MLGRGRIRSESSRMFRVKKISGLPLSLKTNENVSTISAGFGTGAHLARAGDIRTIPRTRLRLRQNNLIVARSEAGSFCYNKL